MILQPDHRVQHSHSPSLEVRTDCRTSVDYPTQLFESVTYLSCCVAVSAHSKSSASGSAVLLRILSTFFHPVAFAYEWGLVPCTEHCKSASKRREKSNEVSCRALQEFAVRISATPAGACGQRKQPSSSRRSLDARFDQPLIKFQASKSPHFAPSRQSSIAGCRSAAPRYGQTNFALAPGHQRSEPSSDLCLPNLAAADDARPQESKLNYPYLQR